RFLEEVGEAARDDQQLLGYATADNAGAAVAELLGDHHPGAMARGDAGRAHTTRAATDHEEIHLPVHRAFLPAAVAGPEAPFAAKSPRSSTSDTSMPATRPQKAAPMPPIATPETVTSRLASAPKLKRPPKDVTKDACSTRSIARPASVATKAPGVASSRR